MPAHIRAEHDSRNPSPEPHNPLRSSVSSPSNCPPTRAQEPTLSWNQLHSLAIIVKATTQDLSPQWIESCRECVPRTPTPSLIRRWGVEFAVCSAAVPGA